MKNQLINTLYALNLFYRRCTAAGRVLPNVFILGAPKCGTTHLADILRNNSNYMQTFSNLKEMHFLQEIENFKPFKFKGLLRHAFGSYTTPDSYRKFFSTKREVAIKEKMVKSGNVITGDFTPAYLYCEVARKRIYELNPQAKLIIMIRNPIARAYSDYNMQVSKKGSEKRTFEEAIHDELKEVKLGNYILETYLRRGIYEPYIRRYCEMFGKSQIMVVQSEIFFKNTNEELKKIHDFLDIPFDSSKDFTKMKKNAGVYREPIKPETVQLLQDYFYEHSKRLSDYLNIDLHW